MSTKMGMLQRLRVGMKLMGQMSEDEAAMIARVFPTGYKTSPYRGVQGMLNAYSKSPWVRAVVGKIGEAVGSTKWALFGVTSAGGKFMKAADLQAAGINLKDYSLGNLDLPDGMEVVPILNHPFLRLLNTANPLFPGSVGRTQTSISLELTGEAFWILDPEWQGGRAVPERFWLIPSTWVRAMPSAGEPYWDIKTPSWEGKLPPQAVFRFVNPDPVNPYGRGSGIMRAFGDEIDTDEYTAAYTRNWFLNTARPDLLITANDLDPADTERLELSWLQQTQSFRRAHKPFFLPKKVDITHLSPKFSDLDMTKLRAWERDIIVHGVGMPPEILGILESSNRATIEAADYLMARYVITPRLELMRTFMQFLLLPIYDDRLILGYESPIQENREYQLSVMTANPAAFRVADWKRQAGVKVEEEDEVYLLPFNLKVVATLTPDEDPTTLTGMAARDAQNALEPTGDPGRPDALPCGCGDPECGASPQEVHDKVVRMLAEFTATRQVGGEGVVDTALALTEQLRRDIIKSFIQLRNELDLAALMQAFDAGDMNAAMALISEADVAASLESAVQTLKQAVVVAGEASAAQLSSYLGESIAFSLTNPNAVQFLEEFGADMVTNITPATRERIRLALKQAWADGLTPQQAAKRIREGLGLTAEMEVQKNKLIADMLAAGATEAEVEEYIAKWVEKKIRYRAQLIAENELVSAGNHGQEMLWDQAVQEGYIDPAKAKRRWVTTSGDKVCKYCNPMDGVEVGIYESWQTGLGPVSTPTDIHIHCHCVEVLNARGS